ncbi:MAG: iron-sulfur cluster repair di-iron protein [Calditrichia bacterium]
MEIFDVRELEPRERHSGIFNKFDRLSSGEGFLLVNDHDPKPLFYQFHAERAGEFGWRYREEGPEVWKVEISRLEKEEMQETLGEIAAKDFRAAEVFKKFGLDFCCGGNKTLAAACADAGVNESEVRRNLQQSGQENNGAVNRFNEWPLDFLLDYIIHNHHSYVKQSLAEMPAFVNKVGKVHGGNHPETIEIARLFAQLANELAAHLQKEERILFPFIRKLVQIEHEENQSSGQWTQVRNPIHAMENEHETAGAILAEIRRLSSNFTLPADACATYEMVYRFLEDFESDLHQHIHLENNLLFPKAMQLASRLTAA